MSIGTRKQVQLIPLVVSQDTDGQNITADGTKFGVWADVSSPSGFRDYQNGQTQMGKTKNFLIRFRIDKYPNANWKIRYEGKDWTVSSIERVKEKRFYWSMTATSKSDV
jgi:SPP1 family predicted phage head-tail adaptor